MVKKRIIKICKECGNSFSVIPCRKNRAHYCSHSCAGKNGIFVKNNPAKTLEFKQRLRERMKSNANPTLRPEVRKKMSRALLGNTHGFQKGHKPSPICIAQGKKNLKILNYITNRTKEVIEKRVKNVIMNGTFSKENNPNWKGGITKESFLIRNSKKMRKWRDIIFKRDEYVCQISGQRGQQLIVHHKNSFNNNPNQRFDITNGVTLTKQLHTLFHKIYGKGNNTAEQYEQFRGNFNAN